MKDAKYFVIWIEGLEPKSGEKVRSISNGKISYTGYMTRALRVKKSDIPSMTEILRSCGIAEWALKNCFVRVNYAPKNTIWKP